jgi:hypothetical protein
MKTGWYQISSDALNIKTFPRIEMLSIYIGTIDSWVLEKYHKTMA